MAAHEWRKSGQRKLGVVLRANWKQTSASGPTCWPLCPSHTQTGSLLTLHKQSACARQAQTSTSIRQGAKVTGRESMHPVAHRGSLSRFVSYYVLAVSWCQVRYIRRKAFYYPAPSYLNERKKWREGRWPEGQMWRGKTSATMARVRTRFWEYINAIRGQVEVRHCPLCHLKCDRSMKPLSPSGILVRRKHTQMLGLLWYVRGLTAEKQTSFTVASCSASSPLAVTKIKGGATTRAFV